MGNAKFSNNKSTPIRLNNGVLVYQRGCEITR